MMLVQECSVMNEDAIVNKNGSSKLVELIVRKTCCKWKEFRT